MQLHDVAREPVGLAGGEVAGEDDALSEEFVEVGLNGLGSQPFLCRELVDRDRQLLRELRLAGGHDELQDPAVALGTAKSMSLGEGFVGVGCRHGATRSSGMLTQPPDQRRSRPHRLNDKGANAPKN